MIYLTTYAKLLVEAKLNASTFANEFGHTLAKKLKTLVRVINSRDYDSVKTPPFAHSLISTSYRIVYRDRPIKITIHMYHFKFPQSELSGLSDEEWRSMLQIAKGFSPVETTIDMLKNRNPLISIRASLMIDDIDRLDVDDAPQYIGKVEGKTIDETTTKIKKLLDDSFGDDGGDSSSEPVPDAPVGAGSI